MTGLGFELSLPMANRFVHLEFKPPAPKAIGNYFRFGDFDEDKQIIERIKGMWGKDMTPYLRKWGSIIATFLERVNPSLIHQLPREGMEFPDCYAFPTPRSWEFAAKLMAAADLYMGIQPTQYEVTELHSVLLVGCIGTGATTPLVDWLDNLDMPDPMAVLQGKAPLPSRPSPPPRFALAGSFSFNLSLLQIFPHCFSNEFLKCSPLINCHVLEGLNQIHGQPNCHLRHRLKTFRCLSLGSRSFSRL